jgi:hypothetical protein
MKRTITRRRMLARLARGGAGLGMVAAIPIIAAFRRRAAVRLGGTRIRVVTRPLRISDIGEGRHLAG